MSEEVDTPRQFAAFVGVGAIAAGANFGSRFAFALGVGFELSVLLAFFVGLTTAFVMNRAWVFNAERASSWKVEAVRFLVVNLLGLVVTMGAAIGCLHLLETAVGPGPVAEGAAHLVGLGCTAVSSYFAHRYWTFGG